MTARGVLRWMVVSATLIAIPSACGTARPAGLPIRVAVAFAPLGDIARGVGGADVIVTDIVPPGNDPHEYDPTPQQITHLEDADAVLYLGGGFQPSIERALHELPSRVVRVDLREDLDLLPDDPHVWLAPRNMEVMARNAADRLAAAGNLDTAGRRRLTASIAAASATYLASLDTLDTEFRDGLAHCATRLVVSSHRSFAYLAAAYGLTQASIAGISPGEEPSAKQLLAIIDTVRQQHVHTIFFDRNMPTDLARTAARAAGATLAVLDPVETFTDAQRQQGIDYVHVMRGNLEALRTGLDCT